MSKKMNMKKVPMSKPITFRSKREFIESVSKYVEKEMPNIRADVTREVSDKLKYIIALSLYDEFGFGSVRLSRFMKKFDTQMECLIGGYVDVDDYKKECESKRIYFKEDTENDEIKRD